MSSPKSQVLAELEKDGDVKRVSQLFSTKTVYKYYRLYLIIKIKERLQWLIDSENYDTSDVPRLKVLLREVKKW